MRKLIVPVCCLLFSFAGTAQNKYASLIGQYMQAHQKLSEFNGAVMVVQKGRVIYQNAFGLANWELNVPNSTKTKFRIGSLTKQFTAAAILQLVEAGKINLDDKLSKYFPDYPKADSVTIHMLLTHTAGIKSFTTIPRWFTVYTNSYPQDSVIAFFKNEPYDFSPGTKWNYSNSNYLLLGYILEKVSGQSFEDYVVNNLVRKGQLSNTSLYRSDSILLNRAGGYSKTRMGWRNVPVIAPEFTYSTAALVSTVDDLYTWNKALYGGKIISPAMLDKMTTPNIGFYGYGLEIDSMYNVKRYSHGGSIPGFKSHLIYFPALDHHIIVLSNNSGDSRGIAGILSAILFDKEIALPYKHEPVKIDSKELEKFVGKYQNGNSIYEVVLKDGKLYRRVNGAPDMELTPESPTRFFYADGSGRYLNFVPGSNNSIRKVQLIIGDLVEEIKKIN